MRQYVGNIMEFFKERLKVDSMSPKINIRIWDYQQRYDTPLDITNVISFSWDRREDAQAQEITFTVENQYGISSPEHVAEKLYEKDALYKDYRYVFWPENQVQVDIGYDGDMITVFTGSIDKIKVSSENRTLEVTARDNVKFLIDQTILLSGMGDLVYKPPTGQTLAVSAILSDLIVRAGCIAEVEEVTLPGGATYAIKEELKFEMGTRYLDAIKTLTDPIGYIVESTPYGMIKVRRNTIPTTKSDPDIILSEYMNVANTDYVVDNQDVRDTIIVQTKDVTESFTSNYLRTKYSPRFMRAMRISIPWADTQQKRRVAAESAVTMMVKSAKKVTVGTVAQPALEINDVVELMDMGVGFVGKFRVSGIKTELSDGSFTDEIELEGLYDPACYAVSPTGNIYGRKSVTIHANEWMDDGAIKTLYVTLSKTINNARIEISQKDGTHNGTITMCKQNDGSWKTEGPTHFASSMYDEQWLLGYGIGSIDHAWDVYNSIVMKMGGDIYFMDNGGQHEYHGYIALINCQASTMVFKDDTIKLTLINFSSLAGAPPQTKKLLWDIKVTSY